MHPHFCASTFQAAPIPQRLPFNRCFISGPERPPGALRHIATTRNATRCAAQKLGVGGPPRTGVAARSHALRYRERYSVITEEAAGDPCRGNGRCFGAERGLERRARPGVGGGDFERTFSGHEHRPTAWYLFMKLME